jgi:hypothetical protein
VKEDVEKMSKTCYPINDMSENTLEYLPKMGAKEWLMNRQTGVTRNIIVNLEASAKKNGYEFDFDVKKGFVEINYNNESAHIENRYVGGTYGRSDGESIPGIRTWELKRLPWFKNAFEKGIVVSDKKFYYVPHSIREIAKDAGISSEQYENLLDEKRIRMKKLNKYIPLITDISKRKERSRHVIRATKEAIWDAFEPLIGDDYRIDLTLLKPLTARAKESMFTDNDTYNKIVKGLKERLPQLEKRLAEI